jgi:hypothetical protein
LISLRFFIMRPVAALTMNMAKTIFPRTRASSVERRPRVDAIRELWKTEATNLERELNTEISLIWRRVRQLERIAIGPD